MHIMKTLGRLQRFINWFEHALFAKLIKQSSGADKSIARTPGKVGNWPGQVPFPGRLPAGQVYKNGQNEKFFVVLRRCIKNTATQMPKDRNYHPIFSPLVYSVALLNLCIRACIMTPSC